MWVRLSIYSNVSIVANKVKAYIEYEFTGYYLPYNIYPYGIAGEGLSNRFFICLDWSSI